MEDTGFETIIRVAKCRLARIAALCPVVLRFVPHVSDPGNGFDVFEAEFYRMNQRNGAP